MVGRKPKLHINDSLHDIFMIYHYFGALSLPKLLHPVNSLAPQGAGTLRAENLLENIFLVFGVRDIFHAPLRQPLDPFNQRIADSLQAPCLQVEKR